MLLQYFLPVKKNEFKEPALKIYLIDSSLGWLKALSETCDLQVNYITEKLVEEKLQYSCCFSLHLSYFLNIISIPTYCDFDFLIV